MTLYQKLISGSGSLEKDCLIVAEQIVEICLLTIVVWLLWG